MRLLVKIVEDWLVRRQEMQALAQWCARSGNVRDSRGGRRRSRRPAYGAEKTFNRLLTRWKRNRSASYRRNVLLRKGRPVLRGCVVEQTCVSLPREQRECVTNTTARKNEMRV